MIDRDGKEIKEGDIIEGSYGIPGRTCSGKVINRDGTLWVLTPGHNPSECSLKDFMKWIVEVEIKEKS